jgi:hypothetical protein
VERSKQVLVQARARGFQGMRILGSLSWLTTEQDWSTFLSYEHAIHQAITDTEVVALCSYPIRTGRDTTGAALMRSHHAVLRPSDQSWEYRATAG